MNRLRSLYKIDLLGSDDARRRALCNVWNSIIFVISLGELLFFVGADFSELEERQLFVGTLVVLLLSIMTFFIVRKSVMFGGSLLVVSFVVGILIGDTAVELVHGRSTIYFVIPILFAGALVRPIASMVTGIVVAVLLIVLGATTPQGVSYSPVFAMLLIATVPWLTVRLLERTIAELKQLNEELEQRVYDRTHELLERTTQAEAILNSARSGILVVDREARPIMVNPPVQRMLHIEGTSFDAAVREFLWDSVANGDAAKWAEFLSLCKGQHEATDFQKVQQTAGSMFGATLAPLRVPLVDATNGDRIAAGAVVTLHDLSVIQAEMEAKEAFFARMSHDLRAPLNSIITGSELALGGWLEPDELLDTIKRNFTSGTFMLAMINNALDRAQMRTGLAIKLDIEEFAPEVLVDQIKTVLHDSAVGRGIEFTQEIVDMPDSLRGDVLRLQQILLNVTNNAIKFTPRGGKVSITMSAEDDGWNIQIADTGAGIPQDQIPLIFDEFHQTKIGQAKRGTGLGLSIVRDLVNAMGGTISVESQLEAGSTFEIRLPWEPPIENIQ